MTNELEAFVKELEGLERYHASNKLVTQYGDTHANGCNGGPYPWQVEFHNAGATNPERAIIAANRVGKTRTGGAEIAIHLTGMYPSWWTGRRFSGPVDGIVAAPTNELVRDIVAESLCGPIVSVDESRTPSGTGWIPKDRIVEWSFRQCGVNNVLDFVRIRHESGGISNCSFKSYEQGDVKFQGVSRHFVWLDEEPDQKIYTEAVTRILDKRGILIFTRTPLFGMSEIVRHFMSNKRGVWMRNVSWDDAPHLNQDEKERLLQSYPEHERKTRAKGIPMMGTGAVYPVPQEEFQCEPFAIPSHFRRLCAVDFGVEHPAAGVWIAHDSESDIVYVYDAYRMAGQTAAYHAAAIRTRGDWIPCAWPHDGMKRDFGGGVAISEQYREHGVEMLAESARYDDDKGGSQPREPITMEILERMRTGRLKVFSHLSELFEEIRMLHRENGVIVAERDDMESALRYAVMSLRFAATKSERTGVRQSNSNDPDYDPSTNWMR